MYLSPKWYGTCPAVQIEQKEPKEKEPQDLIEAGFHSSKWVVS